MHRRIRPHVGQQNLQVALMVRALLADRPGAVSEDALKTGEQCALKDSSHWQFRRVSMLWVERSRLMLSQYRADMSTLSNAPQR
jgi:hypothetical protein